jgi:RNA polymerase sigma-54 factor
MKMGLGVGLGQSLAMTPQLQQAIRMLQMSNLELSAQIQQMIEINPLLELPEEGGDSEPDDGESEIESVDYELGDTQLLPDDLGVDADWSQIYPDHTSGSGSLGDESTEFYGAAQVDLRSRLLEQMSTRPLSATDQQICAELIDSIDDRGYLATEIHEIVESLNLRMTDIQIDEDEVLVVLKLIQHCDPAGVGARDLPECLRLQLELGALEIDSDAKIWALALVGAHEHLSSQDIRRLQKVTQLSLEQVKTAIAVLRQLDPEPGIGVSDSGSVPPPDVIVTGLKDQYRVFLNPDTLPRVGFCQVYVQMIDRQKDTPDQQFLKNNYSEAKQFMRSVIERNRSVVLVASAIVEAQKQFLEQGEAFMKPLILREIADQVGLHESTVSRITTAKTMLTPRGLYELKYFFSSHVTGSTGQECSSTAISANIKELIGAEDPKNPLSDSRLTAMLAERNIEVARRTVAKYRESMGISSSTDRKKVI